MADDVTRYLRQQAALGGRLVVLSEPASALVGRDAPAAAPVESDSPARSEAPRVAAAGVGRSESIPPRPSAAPAAVRMSTAAESPMTGNTGPDAPKWRKDAPAIYPAGMSIVSPPAELVPSALDRAASLDDVAALIAGCRTCRLCDGRTNTVPGEGHPQARLMCVGEGPGENEDKQGRPFVGKAGELLNDILGAIECPRASVYIANVVKCRPPQNRKPLPDEAAGCLPYLRRQIALVRPTVLLALGSTAAEALLGQKSALGEMRGKVHRFDGIPLIVTYHPAALLRNPNWKRPTWDDVRVARQLLDV